MDLIRQLEIYQPYNEQEKQDKKEILYQLKTGEDIFKRENRNFHMTASAWVTNSNRDKVLMAYHNIYHSWSWLGGHADGQRNLLAVAIREVQEESGVKWVKTLIREPFSIEILSVDGHEKKGKYVSSHLHFNITYLLEADEKEALYVKPDENSQVRWFKRNEAVCASEEPWFRERVYQKLNDKLCEWLYKNE